MKVHYRFAAMGGLLLLAFLLACSTIQAAEKAATKVAEGNIAERWVVWPKADHTKEFESAIKEYVAWLKKAGDPFTWAAYQPIVGTDLSFYVFRSDEHQWKDFDAEEAWSKKANDDAQFEKIVAPHVAKVMHFFEETDAEHSHMVGSTGDYKYFQIITRNVKPGAGADARAAIAKIHKALQDQKWPYPYRLAWQIGGKDSLRLIIPLKSYADMADPTPSVRDVLAKALGADAAAETLKQYGSSLEFVDDAVAMARPDLGTQK